MLVAWGLLLVLAAAAAAAALLHRKHALHWLPAAAAHSAKQWFIRRPAPRQVLLAVVDHFEPSRGQAPPEVAAARLQAWLEQWPQRAHATQDSTGRPAQHTFCYPYDEWREGEVAALSRLCYDGCGEVELHLHHADDTAETLRAKLAAALAAFGRHGALLLSGDPVQPGFGFVHGNWALANSRPDGRWCGVDDELAVLAAAGCYADFTFPAPDRCQPPWVNQVRVAAGGGRRAADRAVPLTATTATQRPLLLPGPCGVNLRDWHHRWYPTIERAELAHPSPVSAARVACWVRSGVGVPGCPEWVFVKLHCHGCHERDQDAVLGGARQRLHDLLTHRYSDGRRYQLHYCTARELANLALAAADGQRGDPTPWRDYRYAPPVNRLLASATPVVVTALAAERGELVAADPQPVAWELRVGPVASLHGPVQRLSWQGDRVEVSASGPVDLRRR
ncbi:MAG: hypothetical protein IT204_00795 [Fimbriimonadaceae bacterium]|nr:hypothetical protein [Fimbriimonadaceae bacterium]